LKLAWLFCFVLFCFVMCAGSSLATQTAPGVIYAESFRQGPTQILEQKFDVKLTPHDPTYSERIKDAHGADRYLLSFDPHGPEGDTSITSWQVKLADLQHRMYDNELLPSPNPANDSANEPQNSVSRLDPLPFGAVPIFAKRIIKVESFYVILQVKAYHFTPPDSPYLDSMTVGVEFTDTDPRIAERTPK
jgi:hypothetical protein